MKNFLKNICLLFLLISFNGCSQDNDSIQEESSFDVDEYISYLIGEGRLEKIGGPAPPTIETESSLVTYVSGEGCYTVNLRVYVTGSDGTRIQVANDNVQVGNCGGEKRLFNNTQCEGELADGNLVLENATNDRICLLELLTKSDVVYNMYLAEIQQYQ